MMEILAATVTLLIILGLVVAGVDSSRFVKREYTVYSEKLRMDYTFVLLSDLHDKEYGRDNRRLIRAVESISPDAVLVAGDMFTAGRRANFDIALSLVRRLCEIFPVYYGIGNHEYRMKDYGGRYEEYMEELRKCGVRTLVNSRLYIGECNIELCGLELDEQYYRRRKRMPMPQDCLEQLLGPTDSRGYKLLIAHNPEYFEEYAAWGADLVVSGHVHGGAVRIPGIGGVISPMLHLFPKYDGGLYKSGESRMILSRGLGMHTIPMRAFNPGEIVVIRMKRGVEKIRI